MPGDLIPASKAIDGPLFNGKTNGFFAYYLVLPTGFRFETAPDYLKWVDDEVQAILSRSIYDGNGFWYGVLGFAIGFRHPFISVTQSELINLFDLLGNLLPGTVVSVIITLLVSMVVLILCTKSILISLAAMVSITVTILSTFIMIVWIGKVIYLRGTYIKVGQLTSLKQR